MDIQGGIALSKYLSPKEVAELAQRVAAMAKIEIPVESMDVLLRKKKNQPQYITDGYRQLWLEKNYIAYSTIDDPVVHYAYLTDRHILEEDHPTSARPRCAETAPISQSPSATSSSSPYRS